MRHERPAPGRADSRSTTRSLLPALQDGLAELHDIKGLDHIVGLASPPKTPTASEHGAAVGNGTTGNNAHVP